MKRIVVALVVVGLAALFAVGNVNLASPKCAEGAASLVTAKAPTTSETWQANAPDGVCLQGYAWKPASDVRGVVIIVHGVRDHASRYSELADALAAKGFAVFARDHRGHGLSGGARQRFDSMAQMVDDVDGTVKTAQQKYPGKPIFLYGHSMGGLISTQYTLAHQANLTGLVLSGAALKLGADVTQGTISAAKFFGSVLPALPAQPLDDTEFVTKAEDKAALAKDSLVWHDNLPAASAKAALEGIADSQQRFEQLTLPVLAMHAGVDKATNIEGSRELVQRAKSTDKTFKEWADQRHDLLHEAAAADVIAMTVAFVEAHVPAPTP